MFIIRIFTQ